MMSANLEFYMAACRSNTRWFLSSYEVAHYSIQPTHVRSGVTEEIRREGEGGKLSARD